MYLRYGSFTHPLGEPSVGITRETLYTQTREPYAVLERWNVTGMTVEQTGSATAMKSKIGALETAYAVENQDITILLPDGTTPSTHQIRAKDTIGGIRVVMRPSYPEQSGPQGITFQNFQLAVEATVALPANGSVILEFEETLEFSGGGPQYGHLETLTTPPQLQLLRRMSIYRAIQSGQAKGLYARPVVPAAIWPAALVRTPTKRVIAPKRRGSGYYEYTVSWNYVFEAAVPLIGLPHIWTA
jgi:hypothetical protein